MPAIESTALAGERNIARCRLLLSIAAFIAIYLDPTHPTLTRWVSLTGGAFTIDPKAMAALALHGLYALACHTRLKHTTNVPSQFATVTVSADIAFAMLIALLTEGATSPFHTFLTFPILATGFRSGLRPTLMVTAIGGALYLGLVLMSAPRNLSLYIMRPAYLCITGYLVGFFGQQRQERERRIRELETAQQRERIARSLHDGYAQALASVNLRLEASRQLLQRGRIDDAATELEELQVGVRREFDELREYIRSLTHRALPSAAHREPPDAPTHCHVSAEFSADAHLVCHALSILLEGLRNVTRHAHARSARLDARRIGDALRITIEDDGVGFGPRSDPPWAIASRAAEWSGHVRITDGAKGACLTITLPAA